jgi:hypothetical protein
MAAMAGENPVGTFEQPDFETMTATEYKTALDNAIAAMHRIGGAFAPHETYEGSPLVLTMKVTVEAGYIRSGVTLTEVAAQVTAALVAPISNPRIDRIVGDVTTGAISVVAGAEAGSPSAPAIPAGKFPIARVALTVGQTMVTNQALTDERGMALVYVNLADIADGAAVKIPDGTALKMKVLAIGDWNMDALSSISVAHGLSISKIRSVSVAIISDASAGGYEGHHIGSAAAPGTGEVGWSWGGAVVSISRAASGIFDSTSYDSTSFNRGWITILYDENG